MNPYTQIAKPFYDVLDDCLNHGHTHYWLKGRQRLDQVKFYRINDSTIDDDRRRRGHTIKRRCNA